MLMLPARLLGDSERVAVESLLLGEVDVDRAAGARAVVWGWEMA